MENVSRFITIVINLVWNHLQVIIPLFVVFGTILRIDQRVEWARPLKGFCQFTILRSNFLWVFKKTVLRAQISVSNNFGCFEKLWRSSFVLCRRKIHIMIFRWPTWIFVSNLIHFVQKHTFYSRGSESDFQRLRVLSFDPRANFASPLMFGFFFNFS